MECKVKYTHGIGQKICDWESIKRQKIDCFLNACQAKFGEWTPWSECTLTCLKTLNERSIRTRTRECLDDENNEECQVGRSQSETCNEVQLCSIEGKSISIFKKYNQTRLKRISIYKRERRIETIENSNHVTYDQFDQG